MKPSDIVRAIFYPLTESAVLVPLLFFWVLTSFALWGGVLGLVFLFFISIAVLRFQMIVLEARARGAKPETPGIDFFSLLGNAWTLFPVVLVALFLLAVVMAGRTFGAAWAVVTLLVSSLFLPASLSILAITRSPLQSLNPVAIFRLIGRCGHALLFASAYLAIIVWLAHLSDGLPFLLANLVQTFLWFSFFSVTGALIAPYDLFDEVDIHAPLEKTEFEVSADIEKTRVAALAHAYGFISRDNRAGGFKHILGEIEKDPDPAAAWAWYFERMLGWEQKQHAMFFAQDYIHDALAHGEHVPALKAIMRCRLIDANFKPRYDDLPAAILAAENSGNLELATVLKQG